MPARSWVAGIIIFGEPPRDVSAGKRDYSRAARGAARCAAATERPWNGGSPVVRVVEIAPGAIIRLVHGHARGGPRAALPSRAGRRLRDDGRSPGRFRPAGDTQGGILPGRGRTVRRHRLG